MDAASSKGLASHRSLVALSFLGETPHLRAALEGDAGWQSIWQEVDSPTNHLVLLGFPSAAAAQESLRRRIEQEAPPTDAPLPSEAHHIAIESEQGAVLDRVPVGGFLAMGRSTANLGYGEELRQSLTDTLETFAQVEGHLGSLVGENEAMREEVWTFAFGVTPAAVPQPESSEVLTRLYCRVE